MGTVKVTNIEPIADNGTLTIGNSGDTIALTSGAKTSGFGKIGQVVQSTTTHSFTSTSSSEVDINSAASTVWETSLTPTSTSSKIMVMCAIPLRVAQSSSNEARYSLRMYGKIGSGSYSNIWLADDGNDQSLGGYDYGGSGLQIGDIQNTQYLWSPSTTDECKIKFTFNQKTTTTMTFNRDAVGASCTMMEILD